VNLLPRPLKIANSSDAAILRDAIAGDRDDLRIRIPEDTAAPGLVEVDPVARAKGLIYLHVLRRRAVLETKGTIIQAFVIVLAGAPTKEGIMELVEVAGITLLIRHLALRAYGLAIGARAAVKGVGIWTGVRRAVVGGTCPGCREC